MYCKIKTIPIVFLVIASIIMGDSRSYVWTYEYKTMERGRAEFEHYLTFKAPKMDSLAGSVTTVHNIEFEFGMNDKFDFSIYQNFEQPADGAFQYSGYKLRARYKFGEKNQYLMDPLLYFEYKGKPDFTKHVLEWKLILAKDFESFHYAINPVFEIEYAERLIAPTVKTGVQPVSRPRELPEQSSVSSLDVTERISLRYITRGQV